MYTAATAMVAATASATSGKRVIWNQARREQNEYAKHGENTETLCFPP